MYRETDTGKTMSNSAGKKLVLTLLIPFMLALLACSAKEQPMQGMKIGMHIDAVLEFVVEYPLDWAKDRRINYGSYHGEVRWTHPDDSATMLRILSYQRRDSPEDPIEMLAQDLQDHPEQKVILNEKIILPAGEATHIIAQTPKTDIEAYQLRTADRDYTIALVVPRETLADHNVVMTRVSQSFNFVK